MSHKYILGKITTSSTTVLIKLHCNIPVLKTPNGPIIINPHKTQLKMIKDLNMKQDTGKLINQKVGNRLELTDTGE